MKFTIKVKRWLHGEGSDESKLLRKSDKKMCCLGQYLEACGVEEKYLMGQVSPEIVSADIQNIYPPEAYWLLEHGYCDSEDSWKLMDINDDEDITENHRRKSIKKIFKEHGVEVDFK